MQNMRGRQLTLLQCTYKEIEGVIASKYTRTCTRYIAWKHTRTYTCVCIRISSPKWSGICHNGSCVEQFVCTEGSKYLCTCDGEQNKPMTI